MPPYRKKPVVIEARQFRAAHEDELTELVNWCGGHMVLYILTLDGRMVARPGDYIIKGANGEFYPCKEDIFEKTYEKVEK